MASPTFALTRLILRTQLRQLDDLSDDAKIVVSVGALRSRQRTIRLERAQGQVVRGPVGRPADKTWCCLPRVSIKAFGVDCGDGACGHSACLPTLKVVMVPMPMALACQLDAYDCVDAGNQAAHLCANVHTTK
eukprot:1159676-Pelagomonas_calceolata.AAC.4